MLAFSPKYSKIHKDNFYGHQGQSKKTSTVLEVLQGMPGSLEEIDEIHPKVSRKYSTWNTRTFWGIRREMPTRHVSIHTHRFPNTRHDDDPAKPLFQGVSMQSRVDLNEGKEGVIHLLVGNCLIEMGQRQQPKKERKNQCSREAWVIVPKSSARSRR